MKRYYLNNPRGFANEYTVYVIEAEHAYYLERRFPSATRITRADALEYGLRKPRSAKRNQQQWYGGFAWSAESAYQRSYELRGDTATDADEIRFAATATTEIILEA